MNTAAAFFCITVLIVLFCGKPSLKDAIVVNLTESPRADWATATIDKINAENEAKNGGKHGAH